MRALTARQFALALVVLLAASATLLGLFATADPPTSPPVGIVWHDEGAWTHNARNKALFGAWSLDAWNPMYVAPVFTVLEYASFEAFGVGLRQARLVPQVLGLGAVLLLALGVARIAGRGAGLIAGAFFATNFVALMWNRTAMMEGPMTAFMVAAWYCRTRSEAAPRWAWGAAAGAILAFFTKAAAAFFVAALGLEALLVLLAAREAQSARGRAAAMTLVALTVCGIVALAAFVWPNWAEYRFYNWQMSVTRKPGYDLKSIMFRVTSFPVLHDVFTRMWFMVVVGIVAAFGVLTRWTRVSSGERLLALWIGLGALELLVHDVGNERRFVFFIPAFAGLAGIVLGGVRRLLPQDIDAVSRTRALLALPLVAYALYVVWASIVRVGFLYRISPNVRLAAALAVISTVLLFLTWPRLPRWMAATTWSARTAALITAAVVAGQLTQYVQWAVGRTYENYEASLLIGRTLPPDTLVHGKLANGLALENRIRPVFVGHGFGNFDDRKTRDDVRYILTYIAPRTGYEGSQILEVLDAYPNRSIIMTFDVAETATGHDRAALIDKFGAAPQKRVPQPGHRAQD